MHTLKTICLIMFTFDFHIIYDRKHEVFLVLVILLIKFSSDLAKKVDINKNTHSLPLDTIEPD